MSSNLKVNTILPSTGTTIGIGTVGGLINVVGNIDVNSTSGISTFNGLEISGIVTAKAGAAVTYYGDGSNLTGITGTTINNNADNRLITGSGTANTLEGEANLTYDGSALTILSSANQADGLLIHNTNNSQAHADAAVMVSGGDNASAFLRLENNSQKFEIIKDANHNLLIEDDGTERIRLDSSGRLLIGTTTEGSANADELTISFNNTGVSGGDQGRCGMTIRSGDNTSGVTQNGYIYFSDGTSGGNEYRGVVAYSHSDDSMYFSTAETQKLRIESGGRIGMGAPTTYTDPYRLYLRYYWDATANYANGLVIDSRPDALTTKHIRFYYALHGSGGGSELGSVTSSNAGSVSYNTSSDYRRKKNDVAITDGIAKVKNLRPIRFNWIEQPDITEEGFFAHEAQEVVPNSVFGAKDAVDNDGNPDYQVMDHSKLVPLLTASIKDLITKVETLEAEVAALKGS